MASVVGLSLVVAGILLSALYGLFRIVLMRGFRAPRIVECTTPADSGFEFEELRIPTRNDKWLHAWLLPNDPCAPCVIVLHGWGGNAEMMLPVAVPFLTAGLNVMLLDARCHGRSDDDNFSSLPKFAEDVDACIDWLYTQPKRWNGQLVLLGHSVGAGAVLLSASRDRRVQAVISIAAFSHPRTMMQRYLQRFPQVLRHLIIRQVQQVIGHALDDIAPMNTIRNITCPVLIAHGLDDVTVPADEARKIAGCATHDGVELVLIKGAGHDSVESFMNCGGQLVEFLDRYGLQGMGTSASQSLDTATGTRSATQ